MKLLGCVLITLGSSTVFAKSKSLYLAGTVPLRAEVSIETSKEGSAKVVSKSSPELKVKIQKRSPASIVEVSAP
ncbi:hypothetical protein [Bdellovibrio sp. BCCA]|uniref:hypothetical protein n=1 Tax=Bdellovibrio sp. BCCA TaxID=3136281 RepID=UPI0030F02044